jgi:hypothetical protein
MYIDGQLASKTEAPRVRGNGTIDPFVVRGPIDIDEFQTFSRALTASEVFSYYKLRTKGECRP